VGASFDLRIYVAVTSPYPWNRGVTMSLTTVEEREYMTRVLYASATGSLMYAIVCTRPDFSQAVSMVSRYMHDPEKGYFEAVK